mgnify:CR=1 FL=1
MTEVKRLFDFPYYQLENYPQEAALVSKENGTWVKTSTQQYIDQANAISRGLIKLGVKANDKVAIISMTNRTQWNICDIGILQTGAQDVPIYPTISEQDYEYVLNHSESKYVFVSCKEVLDKINKIRPVKYNKKGSDKKEIGLIAEELEELFPELVEKDENGNPSGVNYSRAVTVLLGGFKELYKELQEIKKRI